MGKKIWLILAIVLIVVGLGVFVFTACSVGFDFSKWATVKYVTNGHTIEEEFENISIETDTADINILPSEDETCKVVCYEQEKVRHTVIVENGTLTIKAVDERKWYDHIGISFHGPWINVYLPQTAYKALKIEEDTGNIAINQGVTFASMDVSVSTGDVTNHASTTGQMKIKTTTGDVELENVSAKSIDLKTNTGKITVNGVACEEGVSVDVSTGDAYLTDITCKGLTSTGNTGDISLRNVVATETFSIERSTGDVNFESCDAGEIVVVTDTGNVKGTLLTEKIFITDTSTGSVRVPNSTSGGICKITTSTGDIKIEIEDA